MGGMIVAEQLLYAFFGPQQIARRSATSLRGSFLIGEAADREISRRCRAGRS